MTESAIIVLLRICLNSKTSFITNPANGDCDYYTNESGKSFDSITIYGGTISIQAKIQLNNYCSTPICNIFYFGDDNLAYPSLSINTITNDFEISITNAETNVLYQIPEASELLPVDDTYHDIEIYISPTHQLFTINNVSYDFYTKIDINNIESHPFYASNPWKNPIDAQIKNICIKSANSCGDTVKGELQSPSDNHYYRVNIFNDSTILFDACKSQFDTYIFLLNDNFEILAENDDVCGAQSQIYKKFQKAGQFILAISGYGNDTYHDYGSYEVTIKCAKHNYNDIECGDIINGWVTDETDFYNYYFTVSNDIQVAFSSCYSSSDIDTALQLLDYNYTVLFFNDDINVGYCEYDNAYLLIPLLSEGQYILGLRGITDINVFKHSGYPQWKVKVICEEINTDPYRLPDVNVPDGISEAKQVCQEFYGTSLATVITDNDALQLSNIIQQSIYNITYVYVGMYTSILNGNKWQWMDDTNCNYTISGKCIDDIHWSMNQPYISDINRNIEDAVYWNSKYNKTGLYTLYTLQSLDMLNSVACNAPIPYGRYSESNCTNDKNCWIQFSIQNSDSMKESVDMLTRWDDNARIPIVFWNHKLILIGAEFIHYTNNSFNIFQKHVEWNDFRYNDQYSFLSVGDTQRYTHYEELLYIFGWNLSIATNTYGNGFMRVGTLLSINLINWDIESIRINVQLSIDTIDVLSTMFGMDYLTQYLPPVFLIANSSHVHIITIGTIIIHDLQTDIDTQNAFDSVDEPIAAVITNDEKHIFIFGKYFQTIKKFDIYTGKFKTLNTVNLCFGISYGVAAINNKIYLHGCHSAYWKTMIFNPQTETFEQQTVNIDYPKSKYMTDYWRGTIEVIDDNVLLLAHLTNPTTPLYNTIPKEFGFNFYYSVTDLISINFKDTQNYNNDIWPSDGFDILYFVNDFDEYSDDIYKMWFYSTNTMYTINASIILNISNDNCICDIDSIYKCDQCSQHFNLQNYVPILNDNITSFEFMPMSDYSEGNITLILPHTISITLQRCFIYFNSFTKSTTNTHPYIIFHYKLSKNCYLRVNSHYSFNITSKNVNINKQIHISIIDNEKHMCQICDIYVCTACNNDKFQINHNVLQYDASLLLLFKSNMIDFAIDSNSNNLQIEYSYTAPFSLTTTEIAGIIIGILIIAITVVGLTFCCYRNRKALKEETTRRMKHAKDIHNPMVISIGIANYFNDETNIGIDDIYCNDLNGIDRDFENIKRLCELCNYYYFPKYPKFEWTQKEIVDFLTECAQVANDNVTNDTIGVNQKFDAILLVVSGHGYQNAIISSDCQLITKTAIHRILSVNFPALRLIPRICIFDACNGVNERVHFSLDFDESSDDESSDDASSVGKSGTSNTEQSKNFDVDDIKVKQSYVWVRGQQNPDFLLALVHSANEGFQAKMNSIDGSYLIYEFIKAMMSNIEENKDLFLVEIMDEIQRYLHDDVGKQQIITNYNSFTQYLRFKVKNVESEVVSDENNREQDMIGIEMKPNSGKHTGDKQISNDLNTYLLDSNLKDICIK